MRATTPWTYAGLVVAGALALAACGQSPAEDRGGGDADGTAASSGDPQGGADLNEACPEGERNLGIFAFLREDSVETVDLSSCRTRTVVPEGAEPPLRWSADGRYLAFGEGAVVRAKGGPVKRALGAPASSWEWAPRGSALIAVTGGGGVVLWRPGRQPRRVLPEGWGASEATLSPSGDLVAVGRSLADRFKRWRFAQQLWTVDLRSGERRRVWQARSMARGGPFLAGFTPHGAHVLLWPHATASLNADGQQLVAVSLAGARRTAVEYALIRPEQLALCGRRLVASAGGGREATRRKRLVALAPPRWRRTVLSPSRRMSWVTPACSPSGSLVATAGGRSGERRLGREARSIWVLPATGGGSPRRLTSHRPMLTDELPRFSSDGRFIAFVRTEGAEARGWSGSLYLLRGRDGWRSARLLGPIADLGSAENYYGAYSWAAQTDWLQPRRGGRGQGHG